MRKKLMIVLVYQLKNTTLGYLLFTPNEFTFVRGYMGNFNAEAFGDEVQCALVPKQGLKEDKRNGEYMMCLV
jgi:hypothetical protein